MGDNYNYRGKVGNSKKATNFFRETQRQKIMGLKRGEEAVIATMPLGEACTARLINYAAQFGSEQRIDISSKGSAKYSYAIKYNNETQLVIRRNR